METQPAASQGNQPHSQNQRPRLGRTKSSVNSSLRRSSRRRASGSGSPHHSHSPRLYRDSKETPTVEASLDNTLPKEYLLQDTLAVIKQLRIFKWRKIPRDDYQLIQLDRISGALTNCIYKVTYKDYYPLLLRLYGDVENIIDRKTELDILTRLSQKNIGPRLLGCFSNGRFEEFLNNSITLNKYHIREARISRMIARRMKELHQGVNLTQLECSQGPKCWILIERWIALIDKFVEGTSDQDQFQVFFLNWTQFKALIKSYKTWLFNQYINSNLTDLLRFCHNDTQYGNLLFYDKSQRIPFEDEEDITSLNLNTAVDDLTVKSSQMSINESSPSASDQLPIVTDLNFPYDTRLTVIDFEYAGANLPAYDLTNHFSEWMYDYHDPENSYKTDETKYPNREERLNLLNSYIKYIPGTTTPSLGPMHKLQMKSPKLIPSRVTIHPNDLPPKVTHLYNETIMWRGTCSIFWALWGILSKGAITNKLKVSDLPTHKYGPNGEEYVITETLPVTSGSVEATDEVIQGNIDDEFDHLKYSNGKIAVAIGDCIQFGLLELDDIQLEYQNKVKFLDCEMIF